MKIFGFARRNYHIAVFALFVAFAAVTMSFTVAYGDDYYYGSFFYEGFSHFVDENIFHYMKTNGRALVHLLDELLLAGGQMVAWRIFGTLCIAAVTLLSALIGAKAYRNGIDTEEFRIALVVSCLLFASISLDIARQSIYWATGALNYLYPILLLLLLFYLVKRGEEKWRCGAAVPVLAFFCAFSTEQCSAGAIAVVAYAFILRIKAKKKPDAAMYFAAVSVALGAALLFSYGRFVLAAISVFALAAVITALARKKTASCAFLLAALCALCFDSMLSFACGYGENYAIHRENAARIEQWKAEGDETAPLHLEYLKNGEYKYIMPYDNVPYHWNWYKTYNRLPPSTEMVFDFPD